MLRSDLSRLKITNYKHPCEPTVSVLDRLARWELSYVAILETYRGGGVGFDAGPFFSSVFASFLAPSPGVAAKRFMRRFLPMHTSRCLYNYANNKLSWAVRDSYIGSDHGLRTGL